MSDYLTFRKMITPVFIQTIFWIAVVMIVIAGLVALGSDGAGPLEGILIIVFGPLIARIYAELFLVLFQINDNVRALADAQTTPAGPEGGAAIS